SEPERKPSAAVRAIRGDRVIDAQHRIEHVDAQANAVAEQRLAYQERVLAWLAVPRDLHVAALAGARVERLVEHGAHAVVPRHAAIEERDGVDGREAAEESDL